VAQIGAAIGREFSYQLVHAVAAMGDAELGKSLDELVDSGLMHRRGSPPEATYIFKHALVQDAAYGTLVRRQRRQLHGRIASALIDRFPAVAQSEPEVVAYHSTEAGEAEQAIGYWLKAGEIASVRSANTEAVSHLRQGLALLRDRPSSAERDRQELEFQCTIGPNLIATHGYAAAETVAAYERARQLMGGDADISRLGTILTGLLVIYYNLAEHDKMLLVASEMLQAAEPRKDATSLCAAHQMIAATYNMRGEFKRANDHAESAWSHYDAKRHAPLAWRYAHDIGVAAKCQIGLSLWHLGFADRARAAFEVALAMAERLNHQNTLGYTLSYGGMFPAIFARDYEALGKHAAQAQQIGRDHKMPQWVAWGACLEAPALALRGQHHQARERLRLGLDLRRQLNNKCLDTLFFTGAALVEMFGDQNDRACSLIDDALANAERTGERWLDAELWCLRGDILMKKPRGGSNEEAGHCYRQATEIGRTQGSLMFQLRAATCLARLLIERGRRSEAERLLAPLYRTFSEGHGTTDLGDAKAVLDSLN
jgi:tetratricopeptide (TPR) repeat protein